MSGIEVVEDTLYIGVGSVLWRSDGTPEGTEIVKEIGGFSSGSFLAVGDLLFFVASTLSAGQELWVSDGTAAGTARVKDIRPGESSSEPSDLVAFGNLLLFSADDGNSGRELWSSDGTLEGTQLIDIRPGALSSHPSALFAYGDAVYLQANNGFTGPELWKSDGTPEGTFLFADIHPGVPGSSPQGFASAGSSIYFQADDGATGEELWRLIPTPLLSVEGTCPGSLSISFSGATPDGSIALVSGTGLGVSEVPVGECAGTDLALEAPTLLTLTTVGMLGNTMLERTVSESSCGASIQFVDLATCDTSGVTEIP